MIKISQKSYQLPLQEKITILGSRVTTSAKPNFIFDNNQIILTDNWVIQLIHTIPEKFSEPQLLEFPIAWEELWIWDQDFPANVTITYKKKPHIQLINSLSTNHSSHVLSLTLETPLEMTLTKPEATPAPINSTTPNSTAAYAQPLPSQPEITTLQQNYQLLEEKYLSLSQTVTELEQRLAKLAAKESEQQPQIARLSGYVVDSFRLIPVSKAILELYQSSNEDPVWKLATNNQGHYAIDDLAPGTYDIKVKHPRYLPLVMKNYVLAKDDNKNQDFLLKRI